MQDIERYGLITLLFLSASVAAVLLWDGSGDGAPDEVVATGHVVDDVARARREALNSRRLTEGVPVSETRRAPQAGDATELALSERRAAALAQAREGAQAPSKEVASVAVLAHETAGATQAPAVLEPADAHQLPRAAFPVADPPQQRVDPTPRRVPTAAVVEARPEPVKPLTRTVKVQAGDSFWTIAERELGRGTLASALESLNPEVDPRRLRVGQELRVPTRHALEADDAGGQVASVPARSERVERVEQPVSGATYVVREGDSAWVIAKRACGAGTRHTELAAANPGVNVGALRVGQRLVLPAGWSLAGSAGSSASTQVASSSSRSKVR